MPQHSEHSPPPQRGRTGRTLPTGRRVRAAVLAGCLALLPLVTACSGSTDDKAASTSEISAAPAAGVVAPARVEVIAELTGCKPKIRIEADELRQGLCHTPKLDYLITTFPEERYKQAWLDSAAMYGGKYLVGPRWIVSVKDPKMLEQFREKTGGTIQQLRGMGPTAGPSAA
ncbi:hypothetical protein GCM10009601_22200 [Streptomyces thermospinosisporus]|uniref:Lipoprotein n=1 Tax=Streptomyces thermospinosisporus TaxID=161482 RepID=A0ABN1YUH8_9ACTN